MTGKQCAEEIVKLWNNDRKEEAKKMFQKSQMILPPKIKAFLKEKMGLYYDIKGIYIYKNNQN